MRTWWEMTRSKNTVMEIYSKLLEEGNAWRENAKKEKGCSKEVAEALGTHFYAIAAMLEQTEEINPTKK